MKITAEQMRQSIDRYEQFSSLGAQKNEDEITRTADTYAREYLGFEEDALRELARYIETDPELVGYGHIGQTLFVAGFLLGAAVLVEAREDATPVEDSPESAT